MSFIDKLNQRQKELKEAKLKQEEEEKKEKKESEEEEKEGEKEFEEEANVEAVENADSSHPASSSSSSTETLSQPTVDGIQVGKLLLWDTEATRLHPSKLVWAPHPQYKKYFPARLCDKAEGGK